MAQYNFEGDINDISDRQLEYINDIIIELGYENSKVSFKPVGEAGDNYVASVKRITIDGEHGKLTIIAKIAPTLESLRLKMNTLLLFRNEHIMYTEVLPKLVQLQKDTDVPEEEQLRYAKCYGSLSEAPNEVILLEDLQTSEFIMLDRFAPISNECVKSVLKNFAVLHSLSYVLKHKEPEKYNYFQKKLLDMWSVIAKVEGVKMYFQGIEDDTLAILEEEEHKDFVRHKIIDTLPLLGKLSTIDYNNKYTVIQQGDSWTNNIMFKFKGDKLIASIMIDYQLSKAVSPVCDIMYMIFNCTDHKTRSENYYDWMDYYHSELDKSLAYFNLKADVVYPRDKLYADLKEYGPVSFGQAVLLASVMIRKSDNAAVMKESIQKSDDSNMQEIAKEMSLLLVDEESKTLFRNRVIGLIHSFTDFELL